MIFSSRRTQALPSPAGPARLSFFLFVLGAALALASLGACASHPAKTGRDRGDSKAGPTAAKSETSGKEVKEKSEQKKEGFEKGAVEDTRPDAQGRPVRTSFFGAELVREKVIVDGFPVTRISIRGGAVLKHNEVVISAPRIELDGGTKGRCLGGVRITDAQNGLTLISSRADYDRDQQTLVLSGRPHMTIRRTAEAAPTIITAERMVRQMGERKSRLEGDVRILQQPWTLLADHGTYADEFDRLELPDAPVLLGPDGIMTGQTLHYFTKERLVRMETQVVLLARSKETLPIGAAQSDLPSLETFSKVGGMAPAAGGEKAVEKKEQAEPIAESLVLSGDRLEYRFPKDAPPAIEVNGNVRMKQSGTELETEHMRALGKDLETIIADRGVRMLEQKNNVRVQAGRMVYQRDLGLLRLDTEPRMDFLKKGTTETTAELTAQVIEREVKTDRTVARGDVRIVRGTTEAVGAHADYDRRADLIVLDGAPALIRGRSRIACERILIFPSRNRVLLRNRISGSLLD